jgi:hypothetical protein
MDENNYKTKALERSPASGSALAALAAREGFRSPDLFVQRVDMQAKTAMIRRMSRAAYRAASFLDSRLLPHAFDGFVIPHDHLVQWVQAITDAPRPIHFIFHAGHVGSTLVSRFIDQAEGVLGLREPSTLRTLALAHEALSHPDAVLSSSQVDTWMATQLRLWRRGYDDTRCVVLKATSDTVRIGHRLMQAAPDSKVLLLNVAAQSYVAMMLSSPSFVDLQTKAGERARRLTRMLGENEPASSVGETAALSWLAEQLTQEHLAHPWPTRTLRVDFDEMLAEPGMHLKAIFHHLGIEAPLALLEDAASHPVMQQYSKNPDKAYSIAERAQRLRQSRRDHAEEIRRGLIWLERGARAHPRAAAALAA